MSNSPSSELRSRLYAGRVTHERFWPKPHRFSHRVFYVAADLDELPELGRRVRGFAVNRGHLFSLRESDYLPLACPVHNPTGIAAPAAGGSPGLKSRVRQFCCRHGVELGDDARVTLVTLPRMFGYAFNPVSFYICRDADGAPRAAIAEVTNTFREVKPYFLGVNSTGGKQIFGNRVPKHFYVSPFSSLAAEFDFRVFAPGLTLAVQIDDYEGGRRTLRSTLSGQAEPLTGARLLGCIVRFPLLTLRVTALIHWHALQLWLKRVPHHPKAAFPALQRDVRRPHRSLQHGYSA